MIIVKYCCKTLFFFTCFICLSISIAAQENAHADTTVHKESTPVFYKKIKEEKPQKDMGDVVSSLFKKKKPDNEKPVTVISKPVFSVIPAIGYSLQSKAAAVVTGNLAFRLRAGANLSTITGNATYTQNKQFYIPVQSNLWTKGNQFNFVGDFRFYKYPQSTFGLGSNSDIRNEDPMDYRFFRFYEVIFKKIWGNFYGGMGYIFDHRWKISHKGPKNGSESDYEKYGMARTTTSAGVTFNALYDTRNNPINCSDGSYARIQLRNNYTALGSNSNWRSVTVDMRKFFQLPGASHNVLAFWLYNWLVINGKPPYLDLPSNGWDSYSSTGRGYIQGRFRGTKMSYLETEYRFRITDNGLIGGVIFANAQTFAGFPGSGFERLQPGFGSGLRIKLNRLSQTNISIDYGFGSQRSNGVFLNIGEVF